MLQHFQLADIMLYYVKWYFTEFCTSYGKIGSIPY